MEQNTQTRQSQVASGNQMPMPNPPSGGPEHKSGVGPIAGALVIVVLLMAGGLYFWGTKMNMEMEALPFISSDESVQETPKETNQPGSDADAGLPPQSESDELSSIEADLNAMDLDHLEAQTEAELMNIE